MQKIKVGDIFELTVDGKYAYGQTVFFHNTPPRYGWLVKIFSGTWHSPPASLKDLSTCTTQFVSFFLLHHYVETHEVKIVGRLAVPVEFQAPPPLLISFFSANKSWYLKKIDGTTFAGGGNSKLLGPVLPECYQSLPYANVLYLNQLTQCIKSEWMGSTPPPPIDASTCHNANRSECCNVKNDDKSKKRIIPENPFLKIQNPIKDSLVRLLNSLDEIAGNHKEIFDTDVRILLRKVIEDGFIYMKKDHKLRKTYKTGKRACDREIHSALQLFLDCVRDLAENSTLLNDRFLRLYSFQDSSARSNNNSTYDEYFGHAEPKDFVA